MVKTIKFYQMQSKLCHFDTIQAICVMKIFYTIISLMQNIVYMSIKKIAICIAHNVPAVYDVLAARISKHVVFAGPTKCAGATAWEWSVAK
jgi:hypothetical protein